MKRILETINALILLFMFVIVILSMAFRVVFQIPASWTEELAQYTLIFLVFIGSATLMANDGHIRITILVDRMGKGVRRILNVICRLFMLPFIIMFTIGAYKNMRMNWGVGLPTVEWMTMGYMYLVLFLSGLFMTLCVLTNLYTDIRGRNAEESDLGGA
jgi:TRAP-type C4-dicarboxylate transport system permease small subunit